MLSPPTLPGRFLLAALPCVIAFAAACAGQTAERPAVDSPLGTWVVEKGLTMGLNPKAKVFAARGMGRDKLACLVSALDEFSAFLGRDITATAIRADGEATVNFITSHASHRLLGYEVTSESTVADGADPEIESLTVIKQNDRVVCGLYQRIGKNSFEEVFYPTLDEPQRVAIEKELFSVFVKDFVEHRPEGKPWIECVFLIDCAPRPE